MALFQTNHCLYCDSPIQSNPSWESLFLGPEEKLLCNKCEGSLQRITGKTCGICGRPIQDIKPEYLKGTICLDCHRWEADQKWSQVLKKNYSLFLYNDFMAEFIARYKYRGDYILAKVFSNEVKRFLMRIDVDEIVPIPLSEERLRERGFNQAEAIVKEAGATISQFLTRFHSEKQSKKTREERIHLEQVFQLKEAQIPTIERKRILLVDDIYTTGSTLRQAAKLLKQAGAKTILSLTLARG